MQNNFKLIIRRYFLTYARVVNMGPIPTGITQNVETLLDHKDVSSLNNSEFVVLLNKRV